MKHKFIKSKDFRKACRVCEYSKSNSIHQVEAQPKRKECKCVCHTTFMKDWEHCSPKNFIRALRRTLETKTSQKLTDAIIEDCLKELKK